MLASIIEERSSPWGSPVTIVAREDGQPRFCVDYRSTINTQLIRKTWPMVSLEDYVDLVGGAQLTCLTCCTLWVWSGGFTNPNQQ